MKEEDAYIGPAGECLVDPYTNQEKGRTLRRYWTTACQACAIKGQCTTGKERRITRWEHEPVLEAVQRRRDAHPEKMRQRPRNRRASIRDHQILDGHYPLPDEDAQNGSAPKWRCTCSLIISSALSTLWVSVH